MPGVVTPNLLEAAKHYMVAAVMGLDSARYNLGLLYERGDVPGLSRNPRRALELFDSAADTHGPGYFLSFDLCYLLQPDFP